MASTAQPRKPRRRQPRQPPDVRREQALDAALELIADGGYRAATMEAVARRMGVAKTVVYAAWGTLEELLMALLAREERRALAALTAAMPAQAPGPDAAPARLAGEWVRRALGVVCETPATWRLVLAPAHGTPAPVRERIERGRGVVGDQIRAALELLPVRPSDPELLALAILAVGEQAAEHVLTRPAEFDPDRYAAFATELVGAATAR